jgi:formylglycine-generating enzyme required for sulfatase activity
LPFQLEHRLIKSKNKSVKNISRTISIGLGALALGAAVAAQGAAPVITDTAMVPRFTIQSDLGVTNQIQYCTSLNQTNWVGLTNLVVTQSPYRFVDTDAPPAPRRFYRVLALGTNSPPPDGMVWIPPGTFVMGSPTSEALRYSDETQHTVTLTKGFYMGKYAVTQGEYLALMGSSPSYFTTRDYNGNPISPDLNRPVEQVSWIDATNYCAHLTQQEQAAGRLPSGWVYRLPTESEWEYACRAGTTTAFHYGNALHGGMANFWDYGEYDASVGDIGVSSPAIPWLPHTTTVGSYQANAWGLHDMHGNVFEWCRDWYGIYPTGSVSDPQGAPSGSSRVVRGGGWGSYGRFCRSAYRHDYGPPSDQGNVLGFRVVLAPGQP